MAPINILQVGSVMYIVLKVVVYLFKNEYFLMLVLLLEILREFNFIEVSMDNDIGYFLPDRSNLDKSARTYVERSDLQLVYDVEGKVV